MIKNLLFFSTILIYLVIFNFIWYAPIYVYLMQLTYIFIYSVSLKEPIDYKDVIMFYPLIKSLSEEYIFTKENNFFVNFYRGLF